MTTSSESLASIEYVEPPKSGSIVPHQVLGRYEILFPIASGGMASVYAARLVGAGTFQKPVALKCMLPHLARDPRFVAMFMDEAQLAARIQSPYVVPVLELSKHDDDTLFMALELVVGVSLREWFEACEVHKEPVPVRVAATLLIQAARGLHDAHEARSLSGEPLGLIHRDVSPHNVLVGVDGRARISDFGIARAVERLSATQTGELKGKLPYFSPEQIRCAELDRRSDVFSLGIVAWELFTGARLFHAPNPLATAQAIAAKPIPRVDEVRPEVPRVVAEVIATALERDLSKRTASAEAFALALTEACERSSGLADAREVIAALRTACGPRIARFERELTDALREPTEGVRPVKAPPRKKPRWVVWIVALIVGSALGYLASTSPEATRAPELSTESARPEARPPQQPVLPAPVKVIPEEAAPKAEATDVTSPAMEEPVPTAPPQMRKKTKRALRKRTAESKEAKAAPTPAVNEGLLRGLDEFDRERGR